MTKKNFLKIVILILLFVGIQTYFQDGSSFKEVIAKWTGYFIPLIWAIFISILLNPAIDYFERKFKINKISALSLVIFIILLLFIGILIMIIPEIIATIKEINELYPHIVERTTEISKKIIEYLAKKDIFIFDPNQIGQSTNNFIRDNFNDIQKFLISILQNVVWWTLGLINFFMGLFLAILILLNKKGQLQTRNNILTIIFGVKTTEYIVEKINASNKIFLDYVVGKLIVSFFVGLSVFIILIISKTPYAALSAVLLGVGNMIPYVGSIIGGIIATFLIFIVAPIKVIFLFIAIVVSQLIDGFIIGPKIIGDKVGLSSFWVILSIIIFGGLFGIVGMFLGVPIMCIIRLFYFDLLEKAKNKENE